jgi:hypothetical protein
MEDAPGATTSSGDVYVFNVSSEALDLSLNGAPIRAGTIPGWSLSAKSRYQPGSRPVPRVLHASDGPGNFFNGVNQLFLSRIDGVYVAQIGIDGRQLPSNQELLLFISLNQWQLVNQYGVQVSTGTVRSASDI